MKANFLIILVISITYSNLRAEEPCLTNAWNAYNSRNYREAIRNAEQCIDDFGRDATMIQHRLDSLSIDPGNGRVNDIEKNRIFNNGLLNDVSTACFIKGRSSENIYKEDRVRNLSYKQIAIDSYRLACTYSKGRCWDIQGWFWSPCEASTKRLPIN